jgi:hypothetical protein
VHVRKVEHRADEGDARGDLEDVVERAELAHAAHHLDAEWDEPTLALEPVAEQEQLFDNGVEGTPPLAPEQIARVKHDHFCTARGCQPCAVIQHPHRHAVLLG